MRSAILVGIDKYERPGMSPLVGCVNDVKDMASYLIGIGTGTIRTLCDAEATRSAIYALVSDSMNALREGNEHSSCISAGTERRCPAEAKSMPRCARTISTGLRSHRSLIRTSLAF